MGTPRDYYADLELPPTADAAEIRKQYRKLALKYHPDRNPGREAEVNTQFQIIQTAHEILSDPEQKAKHDASRGRGRFPGASGVKGNPWSNVSAQYPPPPRRNNANPRAPPSGAQRWQRFSTGVPPTAKQYTASDAESKKNAARAQRQEASFGARKTGFHPRTTVGDEPPVSSSNYSSRPASERYAQRFGSDIPQQAPPPTPQRPPPTAMPDPLSQFRDRDSTADPRQSSPYASNGGEKTNPFDGISINRAKSTREATRQDQSASENEAFNRQRSASAPKGGKAEDVPLNNKAPEQPSIPRDPADRPKAPLKKTRSGFKSVPLGPNQQATEFPANDKPTDSPGGPTMYGNPFSTTSSHPFLKSSNKCRGHHGYDSLGNHCPYEIPIKPSQPSPSGRQDSTHQLTPFERQQQELLSQLINNASPDSPAKKPKLQDRDSKIPSMPNRANKVYSNSFSFPVNDDTFARTSPDHHRFSRRSTDDINTSFADEDDAAGWEFNAGGAEQDSPSRPRKPGRRSPGKRPPMSGKSTPSFMSDAERSDSAKPESAFNPAGWDFGPQTFVPQPSKSVSPTRSTRTNSRKPKASKKSSHANLVDDSSSEDEVLEWRGRKVQEEPLAAESPQAMDIDTPPAPSSMPPPRPPKVPSPQPAQTTPSLQPAQPVSQPPQPVETNQAPGVVPAPHAARNINVEPTRPEWRPGNVDTVNGNEHGPENPRKAFNPNNMGSEDSEEFQASFADLRNVAPFTQQSSGLKSFSDLKDNLPFESKAAPQIPMKLPKVHPLIFPAAPTAPQIPAAATINGVKPSALSWETYVKDFEHYLKQWDTFNAQVVDHFATRKSHIARTREEKGYSFLENRGDADIQEYYNWLEQDMDVRRRWAAACEEHEHRFREFMAFRMKMR
ncbi:DnaJ domain [Fusarium oxysporum f. sp. vasinfectum]|nr:DnaJ domain [Fusarium oxysporum f. sp. vasinfectum]